MNDNIKLFWSCTLGKQSHLNILGKIVFFPAIVLVFCVIWLLEHLFSKPGDRWL